MHRLFLILLFASAAMAQTPCEDLQTFSFPGTTITAVELIPAGPYQSPAKAQDSRPSVSWGVTGAQELCEQHQESRIEQKAPNKAHLGWTEIAVG